MIKLLKLMGAITALLFVIGLVGTAGSWFGYRLADGEFITECIRDGAHMKCERI
jgi:hypothetical protein